MAESATFGAQSFLPGVTTNAPVGRKGRCGLSRKWPSGQGEGLGKAGYQHVEARRARAAHSVIMYDTLRAVYHTLKKRRRTFHRTPEWSPNLVLPEEHPRGDPTRSDEELRNLKAALAQATFGRLV
jgi:hypothetical protein